MSRALVSIVMRDAPGASDATRARVRAAADELGYRPDGRARLLAGRRTRLLGVALTLNNPFHADVAEGVYAAAEEHGYQVVLGAMTAARGADTAVEALLAYRCEALILLGAPMRAAELGELAHTQPVVVVGQASRTATVDTVRAADGPGLGLAVEHLAGLGHRSIVHVDGGRAPASAARRTGYRAAMKRLGLEAETRVLPGGEREEDGAEARAGAHRRRAAGRGDHLQRPQRRRAAGRPRPARCRRAGRGVGGRLRRHPLRAPALPAPDHRQPGHRPARGAGRRSGPSTGWRAPTSTSATWCSSRTWSCAARRRSARTDRWRQPTAMRMPMAKPTASSHSSVGRARVMGCTPSRS